MANFYFSVLDYFVFIATLVFSSLIGAYFWIKDRKAQSKDYLTGGRNLPLFPVTMSLAASFLSTNTLLGTPAEVYLLGTQFAVGMIMFSIAVIVAAEVFMPIYYAMKLTSVNKYLLRRFNSNSVRLAGSMGFILCTVPYMGAVLYGPSVSLSAVTTMSTTTSVIVVGFVCTFYTAVGGIKAVIWSDVFQCSLMLVGILIVTILGAHDVGLYNSFQIAKDEGRLTILNLAPSIYRSDTFWSTAIGLLVLWTGTYCVNQAQVQRYCCMKTKTKAKVAIYLSAPIIIVLTLLSVWCGIILMAKYRGCDPIAMNHIERYDQLMPYYVMENLAHIPGLPGLFVACIFSGSLSTLSSGFNALATVTWDDFLKKHFKTKSDHYRLIINKLVAALYGMLAIGVAFTIGRLGTVLQASIAMSGAIAGPLLGLFCLGLFFKFVNIKGALSGFITGIALTTTIAIGSIVNKKPNIHLTLRTDLCPDQNHTIIHEDYVLPHEYEPHGFNKLFHINYYYVSTSGFIVCVLVGILVSLITRSNRREICINGNSTNKCEFKNNVSNGDHVTESKH